MNPTEFNGYKARYRAAIQQVLAQAEKGRLDEAAFPAYSHPNPLINWLFWQRLRTAMNHIARRAPYERVLDFGCGSGVMLPFLSQNSKDVIATDLDLVPLERVKAYIPLAANVDVRDGSKTAITDLPENSLDVIVALDVLEHVHDLPRTLNELVSRLKPGGELVVSGPTENILYRLGRRVAGPEYSGDYHERGIAEIKQELKKISTVNHIATLYWPVPLFEIFSAEK
jgi:2-polyprenyl-3-methyl-5-hydroxy-6-metoxy-1,4-benzoquinol methylase